jgi:hypothetical protein
MRDPRNALRPFAVKETRAALEKCADQLFGLDVLIEAITTAALKGEGAVKLPLGPFILDLRSTAAARVLVEWVEDNGMRLEWAERLAQRPSGLRVKVAEPIISWTEEAYTLG